MRKITILSLSALFLFGCSSANQQTANIPAQNAANSPLKSASNSNDSQMISSHSQTKAEATPTPVPKSGEKTKWTQSGNPIDTTAFDAEVKAAEDKLKTNAKDENLKKAAAEAYVKRGIALTEARQYASALGDYRKAQKLDPKNEEAKTWIEQIVTIYKSINRDYPPEGEEPPPLPFKKTQL